MKKFLAGLVVFVLVGMGIFYPKTGGSNMAEMVGTYTFDWCRLGSTDGTQVFKSRKIIGCAGSEMAFEYIADLTLEALCYVPSRKCVSMQDTNTTEEQRREYTHLATHARVEPGSFRRCTSESSDGTVVYERHVPRDVSWNGCTPNATARSYNWVMNDGCVWLGRELVGCVTLPKSLSRDRVAVMLSR